MINIDTIFILYILQVLTQASRQASSAENSVEELPPGETSENPTQDPPPEALSQEAKFIIALATTTAIIVGAFCTYPAWKLSRRPLRDRKYNKIKDHPKSETSSNCEISRNGPAEEIELPMASGQQTQTGVSGGSTSGASGQESQTVVLDVPTSGDLPGTVLTGSDEDDVIEGLSPSDLQHLYTQLPCLIWTEIQKAEGATNRVAVNIRAERVFRFWRKVSKNNPTRKAILDALVKCKNVLAKETLEKNDKWRTQVAMKVSDEDFQDVISILGPPGLKTLFLKLDLSDDQITRAENDVHTSDVYLKAKRVFKAWRNKCGERATQEAVLSALERCKNKEAKENLEEKWNQAYSEEPSPDDVPEEDLPGTVLSGSDVDDVIEELSPNDLHELYNALPDISWTEVEHAQGDTSRASVHIRAERVFRWWRKKINKAATRKAILNALVRCKNVEAKETLEEKDKWKTQAAMKVSDEDFEEVIGILDPSTLQMLFFKLGLNDEEITKAENDVYTSDVYLKAKKVFKAWCKKCGKKATREAVLSALEHCKNIDVKEKLEDKWKPASGRQQRQTGVSESPTTRDPRFPGVGQTIGH